MSGRPPQPGGLEGDGGDAPAWSRHREPYQPAPELVAAATAARVQGAGRAGAAAGPGPAAAPYAELHCHSAFSFLDGASQPEELVEEAARLGLSALALTDHDGMYGVVRFAEAAGEVGLPTLYGVEVSLSSAGPGQPAPRPGTSRHHLGPGSGQHHLGPGQGQSRSGPGLGQRRPGPDGAVPAARPGVPDPAGDHLLVLARTPAGYRRLSRAVSDAHLAGGEKGRPLTSLDVLAAAAGDGHWQILTGCRKGLVPAALAAGGLDAARVALDGLVGRFGRDNVAIELWDHAHPLDSDRNDALYGLAQEAGLTCVATNNVHYATPSAGRLAAVMASIRARRSLDEMDGHLPPAGAAHLRSGVEMTDRFARYPGAVAAAARIGVTHAFDLRLVAPKLPDFPVPPGHTEASWLRLLTMQGAARRYGPPERERVGGAYDQLAHELTLIESLGFPGYFLIVHDIVEFCRREDVLCQGRGSAANSAVCYALGITGVDAVSFGLLFERFLAPERDGPPDIDLDIESGRREEVIQYVYGRYGRDRAAQVANVISYRSRSAVRDVARALGFSPGQQDAWSSSLDRWSPLPATAPPNPASSATAPPGIPASSAPAPAVAGGRNVPPRRGGAQPRRPLDERSEVRGPQGLSPERTVRSGGRGPGVPAEPPGEAGAARPRPDGANQENTAVPAEVVGLAGQLLGFPRHLGIHSGGMVICDRPVAEVVPVEWARMPGRTVIQWDKDDCAVAGLVKFDLLGLGMLGALHLAFALIRDHHGRHLDLGEIPPEDPAVYDMLCAADSIGVFQVESRAQMATLPRLKPRRFYDLVVEVALIRPGPIQGGSVHPYIRRRNDLEEVAYPHPLLERSLKKTLGIPLFQEQLMQMAIDVAGFTAAEADQLRRAMGAKRATERIDRLRERFYQGMATNGITGVAADELYTKLAAFANFGFPESHSVSFAFLVYASAWIKLYYPAAFCAALVNAQPMGFYSPQSLVADARRHGVTVHGPDLNASGAGAILADGGRPAGLAEPVWDGEQVGDAPAPARIGAGAAAGPAELGGAAGGLAGPRHPAVRLGLAGVRLIGAANAERIVAARGAGGPYRDMADLVRRTGLTAAQLEALATAGAFGCFGLARREALWAAGAAAQARPDRLEGTTLGGDPSAVAAHLPGMSGAEEIVADLWATGITPSRYPTEFVRDRLDALGVVVATRLAELPGDRRVVVAGVVTHRQRPATAGGTTFLNLEDETGLVNVICSRGVWVRHRVVATSAPALIIRGRLEKADGVVNVIAERLERLPLAVARRSRDFR
ncbi:error-prone DNA polymerase [Pseudofrankia sp. DC12]|uniref:error-prone DNA polymerase n=1 Tax=Pseudofrankia sp. DC12 TaxID=683315 RepID=UPI0005F8960C|nr:error-prone DNA polymerase [Pseudofrankia sp. DC12]